MVRAYSSGVEHYVDIVGVPSSNLGTPTIIPSKGVAVAAPFAYQRPVTKEARTANPESIDGTIQVYLC